ncbi:MAG: hypothetical protein QM813_00505 [Verrucomicrobiota bacterium]
MNTETYEIETNKTSEAASFNRLAGHTGTRATSSLRRFSTACLSKLNEVKERVTRELVTEHGAAINVALIRQAVQEADSLAATTPFPSLFLPALAEEKVLVAAAWNSRQASIRDQTLVLAA